MRYQPALLAAALLFAGVAGGASASPAPPAAKKSALATANLKITGMHCEGCASGVTQGLKKVKGVKSVKVEAAKSGGSVQYDPAQAKPADLVAAVKKSGYQATVVK